MSTKDEKTAAVATTGTAETSLERPSFMKDAEGRGLEHLTKDDLQIPRLALAQGLTPQVAEGKEGFTTGVMFHSVSERIYGKGPLRFAIIRADKPRFVEFIPRELGGGVKDMNVPASDPRTQFGKDGSKPLATKFYDFFIVLLPMNFEDVMDNVISLSFKSTGLKVARGLNMLMARRRVMNGRKTDIFEHVYEVKSIVQKNSKGIFANYEVQNAGFVSDEGTYKALAKLFEDFRDKAVDVHREGEDVDDVDDSMAANPEGNSGDM